MLRHTSLFSPVRWLTFAFLASAVLLLSLPVRAGIFDPDTFTLDNGMQVVVVKNHRAPVVVHMVWYRVGAMDEPPGKSGLAHYLEHLMFKGTNTLAPGEFSAIVRRLGGQDNAFTAQDYTGYFQSVAADRLGRVMELEADRMINLVLTPEIIEPERGVILEERRSRIESSPASILSEQVNAAHYQNHPYRIPIIGWEDEIRALTLDDITSFYRQWYTPNNAVLVVAGDVEVDQVKRLAEKHYGPIPARPLPERVAWIEPAQRADRNLVYRDVRVRQPGWSRRFKAPSHLFGESQHAYPLQVLSEILSGGATTRLYRTLVVEQGIATNAGSWYRSGGRGPSSFGFYASPVQGGDLDTVEAAMNREIEKLIADGVSQEEVDAAILRLQDAAVFARDSLRGPAQLFGSALVVGRTIADVEEWPDRIGRVTADDVNRAIEAVFADRPSTTAKLLPQEAS